MEEIKVGVIGIGSMGRHHVRNVRETPGETLVAVADPGGDKFGVAGDLEVLPDVEALIAAGIEAAIVAVPTAFHREVALQLAAAGVHTLIEKPLAPSVAEGREIVAAFEAAGVVGACGYVERCNPALMELSRRVKAGELGEIFQIATRRQGPFPVRIADVGVIQDLATHDVDLTAWLAGAPYRSIAARAARKSGRDQEDLVLATGVLENGVIVNHVVNWFSPFKERVTTVTGERGALVADTMNSTLTFFENGTKEVEWDQVANVRGVSVGEVRQYALDQREPLRVEHENFLAAIAGDTSRIVSLGDALGTLRVLDGIVESCRTGETITLNQVG
ncbi:putative dehydrogenase [Mobiluncus mulieris]|uniref:Inositol 2-dehydrogenase n=1 Tax=Mobiluncus mulieris TaxID=2052 RepID=A0A2X1RZ43_9ACTO|nr:Gfo/Idh/MocA family oxidoreductase [Mobiluncus mulieris]EEJ54243.1 oxidoreductase, NAD-binding domain protein [Mobiluncus mulieris ATCC 35243]MBB5846341.1 putative dehydrogenase [Mobiluncus mulieris]MCV0012126.1 Gfo/Idh/MocA family oxidoreductase [Mobiluncus mulieris]NMX11609.1 Gfo/Idh/MocA family oxidoreductase [Mobiluncus mulieris]SPX76178.1 Inositol 2-dehydrogenase [Mobiluncus mulieris]